MRQHDRAPNELRPTTITPNFLLHAEGSVLIEVGRTRVVCAASVEDRVPPFLRGTGKGWVTAEYGMLPRATSTRTQREASAGKVGSRVDSLLLYCYHYDPMTGRYGLAIMRAIRLAGGVTIVALGSFIIIMLRREKRIPSPESRSAKVVR